MTSTYNQDLVTEYVEMVSSIPLPRSVSRRIPLDAIEMANNSLAASYPGEYGTLIPPLTQDAILVASDADVVGFHIRSTRSELHTATKEFTDSLKTAGVVTDVNGLKIWTLRCYKDKPIIYYEGDITEMARKLSPYDRDFRKGMSDSLMARVLVHEDLHRSCGIEIYPISPEDPLFEMAFAVLREQIKSMQNPEIKKLAEDGYRRLHDYAAGNSPMIKLDGSRVSVICRDIDDSLKCVISSGYDLEEGCVDTFGKPAYDDILSQARRKFGFQTYTYASASIKSILEAPNNYIKRNIMSSAPSYFRRLGLGDLPTALHAFIEGRIPTLHAEKLPTQEYFV